MSERSAGRESERGPSGAAKQLERGVLSERSAGRESERGPSGPLRSSRSGKQ
jgi:hypothetical protein